MSSEEKPKGKMTVAEAGRKGGEKTAQTHGREFYEYIGRKGGEKVAHERGHEFYSQISSKGHKDKKKQEASQQDGQRVRKLIQAGLNHEEEYTFPQPG